MYHMWEEEEEDEDDEEEDEEDEEETSFAYIITYDYIICMLKSVDVKATLPKPSSVFLVKFSIWITSSAQFSCQIG